jgi:hypothetical protein
MVTVARFIVGWSLKTRGGGMAKDLITVNRNGLRPTQFGDLADVPTGFEWL